MTGRNTYWLTDGYGNKALVEGATERDRWIPHGWSESTEPTTGEQVWMQHTDHQGRTRFPAAAAESWKGLGWQPAAPPEPVDLLHDQQLVDQPTRTAAAPAAETKPTTTPAASAKNKE